MPSPTQVTRFTSSAEATVSGVSSQIESRNPATGEVLGRVPVSSTEEVRATVASARRAQEAWALLPIEERTARLLRFRNAIVDRGEEIVELLSQENGKTRHESLLFEVFPVAEVATYLSKHAAEILSPQRVTLGLAKYRTAYLQYVPRGVVAIISPWNFPFVLSLGDTLFALAAGNAVVLKPSEVTPLVLAKAKEIWDATAGLPRDLFQVVQGYGKTGSDLIDAQPDMVVFTGGVATGKRVAAMCGERLIPCTLELGGKAPLIACEDADIERTARGIVFGGFANSGQICISVERVYAHAQVHDRLLERVVGLVSELRQGDPMTSLDLDVGAMTFDKQVDVVEKHIADAKAKGAVVRTGGTRKGMFFAPTVLAGCNHDMTVMTEEIFGPIVPFMKVASEDEAIAHANDSHLGLNAYVFTADREKGRRIAERVLAGSVVVNDVFVNYAMAEAPFGGVKQSGIGRVHGPEGLRSFCHVKHVNVDRFGTMDREPTWYPFTKGAYGGFQKAVRALFGGGSLAKRLGDLL